MNQKFLSDKVLDLATKARIDKGFLHEFPLESCAYDPRARCLMLKFSDCNRQFRTAADSFYMFLARLDMNFHESGPFIPPDQNKCISITDGNGLLFATIENHGDYVKIVERGDYTTVEGGDIRIVEKGHRTRVGGGNVKKTDTLTLIKAYALTMDQKYWHLLENRAYEK